MVKIWLPFLFFTYISLAIISLLRGLFSLSTQGSSHPLPLLYLTTAAPAPQLLLVKQKLGKEFDSDIEFKCKINDKFHTPPFFRSMFFYFHRQTLV